MAGQAGDQVGLWTPLLYRLHSSTVPHVSPDVPHSASVYLDDLSGSRKPPFVENDVLSLEPTPLGEKSADPPCSWVERTR